MADLKPLPTVPVRPVASARPRGRRIWSWSAALLLLPATAFVIAFFVVPLVLLFIVSLRAVDQFNDILPGHLTLTQYRMVLTQSYFWETLLHSAELGLMVTAACLVLAFPVAHSLVFTRSRALRALLYAIVVSPLLTSAVVRSFGWIIILAANGPIAKFVVGVGLTSQPPHLLYTESATLIAMIQVLLPFAVLPLTAALATMDPNLLRASAVFGAGPIRTLRDVWIPVNLSGFLTAALLVYSITIGLYVTPLLVGGSTQSLGAISAYVQATSLFDLPLSAALSLLLVLIALIGAALMTWAYRIWEKHAYG